MKKENFKYLYSFKYDDKEYVYLISKNYPFYFLEYNSVNNNFVYPDINTFKKIYNKFYNNDNCFGFDIIDRLKKLKKTLNKREFNIVPLVKGTSGLISVALALSLCGCMQTNDIVDTSVVTEPTATVGLIQDKNQQIYNYFKKYNMDVIAKEYGGNDYIFVNEFINSSNMKQITLNDFDEFRKLNNIDFIPTWEDVIKEFQNNKNIDDEKKNIILDGINNLRNSKEMECLDLSILYVNAKRMNIKYLSSTEMVENTNRNSVYAYFDALTGTVYLPNDKQLERFEFIHEVLGHGALSYRKEFSNSLIVFDCTNYLMLPTDNRYSGYSVGTMVSEGGANMIAHFATGDYSVSTFYELYEEELRVIANFCNVSLGELFNYKGVSLYDLMYNNGIDTPVEYIFKMDGIYKGQIYCEFSYLMERLFLDATEEKLDNLNEIQQNEFIKSTVEMIKDSYFKEKGSLSFSYGDGSIDYNFEESASNYEETINKIR